VVWKDETGKGCFASRGSLAEAKTFQTQKIAELERHREGRFNLGDREMLRQARDLASSHGYTVLQEENRASVYEDIEVEVLRALSIRRADRKRATLPSFSRTAN
jgi:hypothetical protein